MSIQSGETSQQQLNIEWARTLEEARTGHSRVYYFRNGGAEKFYLGSADLMRRNLSHRVEILFPVGNPKLLRRLKDSLNVQLADEKKSHYLQSDGHYIRSSKSGETDAIDSRLQFLKHECAPLKVVKGLEVLSRKRRVTDRRSQLRTRT